MTPDVSRYLEDLPAIFSQEAGLLGRFLLAFEQVLTGLGDPERPGLEEILDGISGPTGGVLLAGVHRYFDPGPDLPETERAPREFLDWLAGWVALTLREDWRDEERRRILSRTVLAYRWRGTRKGLQDILAAYTGADPASIQVSEFLTPFELGATSYVGLGTVLGGGPPHYFLVDASVPVEGARDLARKEQILRAIIDAEKPAHTYYDLRIQVPTMQLGKQSTIGVDTVLGTVL
jgi:phage tail-like protein